MGSNRPACANGQAATTCEVTSDDQTSAQAFGCDASFLANVIDGVADPIFVKDEKHRWILVNEAFCRFTGHPREALLGRSDFDIFPAAQAEAFCAADDEVFATGVENINEEDLTDADGKLHVLSTRKSLCRDPRTGRTLLVGVIRDITEQKAAETGSALLAAVVSSSTDAILSKGLDGIIRTWNAGAEALYGYSAKEMIGRSVEFLLPPERASEERRLLQRIERGERIQHFDTARLHKDGSVVPVSLTMSPIRDVSGRIVGVSSIAHDISDRIRAEQSLRESEAQFHEAFASAPAGIVFTAPDGRFFDVNGTLCTMLGYTAEELTGKRFTDITHPDDVEPSLSLAEILLSGRTATGQLEKRYLHRDGTFRWVSIRITLLRDAAGKPRHFVTHVLDITDRKVAEAATQASEARFRGFVESLIDGFATFIAVRDSDGGISDFRFDYINEAGCALNRMPREWHLGRTLLENFPAHRGTELFAEYVRVVETGTPLVMESVSYEDAFGESGRVKRVFDIRVVKCGDGFAVTWRDITDRTTREEKISMLNAELEKNAARLQTANQELETFAYSVSHDLQAPLRHIDGFLGLLEKHLGTLDERGMHYLTTVVDAARDMSQLIDDLLEFSRLGRLHVDAGAVDTAALVEAVRKSFSLQLDGREVRWTVGVLPEVFGDSRLLRQVFSNLIGNALKYTVARTTASIEIGCSEEADELVFFVRDNGVGFDMQYAHKLFGVFERLHSASDYEGTGIGLAIVDRIVRRHGGRTWAEGSVGEGATFYFCLPRRDGALGGPVS